MILLKDTANQFMRVKLVSVMDHETPVEGVVDPTITLSKNNGVFGLINDGQWTELGGGFYAVRLNATDLEASGPVELKVVATDCDDAYSIDYVAADEDAADSVLSYPAHQLRTLVASSSSFQGIVGAASAAEALPFVYLWGVGGNPKRPCVMVREMEQESWVFERNDNTSFVPKGAFHLIFEFTIPPNYVSENDISAAHNHFLNLSGAVLEDVLLLSTQLGIFTIESVKHIHGIARSEQSRIVRDVDYLQLAFEVVRGL